MAGSPRNCCAFNTPDRLRGGKVPGGSATKALCHHLIQGTKPGGRNADYDGAASVWMSCFNHDTAGLLLYSQLGFVPTHRPFLS
jgi:hypothetical protein